MTHTLNGQGTRDAGIDERQGFAPVEYGVADLRGEHASPRLPTGQHLIDQHPQAENIRFLRQPTLGEPFRKISTPRRPFSYTDGIQAQGECARESEGVIDASRPGFADPWRLNI